MTAPAALSAPTPRTLTALGVLLAALLGLALGAPHAATTTRLDTGDPVNLSVSPGVSSRAPSVAVTTDGQVHVVWEEDTQIYHRYSVDGGETWSPPAPAHYHAHEPALTAVGAGGLAMVYTTFPTSPERDAEVAFKRWQDDSWGSQTVLGPGTQPDVASDPDTGDVWVVWANTGVATEPQPYYGHIRGEAIYGSGAVAPTFYSNGAQAPAISVAPESRVHVVWSEPSSIFENGAYVRHASRSEQSMFVLTGDLLFKNREQARVPDVVSTTGHLCMTWQEGNNWGGTPQKSDIVLYCDELMHNISNSIDAPSLVPQLAVDDTRYGSLVVWQERSQPLAQISYHQGQPPVTLEAIVTNGTVDTPALAYHSGWAHTVWVEGEGADSEVRFARWELSDAPTPTATPSATTTPSPSPTVRPSVTPTGTRPSPTATRPSPTTTASRPTASVTRTPSHTPPPTSTEATPTPGPIVDWLYVPYLERH